MRKTISIFIFAIVLSFVVSSCTGSNGKTVSDSTKSDLANGASVNGEELFLTNCANCHGDDGRAGTMGAGDLGESKIDHGTAVAIIKIGKNAMQPFNTVLNDAQIDAVASYIETFRK